MEDEEMVKKLEAIVSALAALKSSLDSHKRENEEQFRLFSRRLARIEKKLALPNGTLALDSVEPTEQHGAEQVFWQKLNLFTPQEAKKISDDDCLLPKKRGRPPKKQK